jgi:hypothetical protein
MALRDVVEARFCETDLIPAEFDHAAWTTASPVRIERQWSGEPAPPSRRAEVRILWSMTALSVRFICNQQEPLTVDPAPKLDEKTIGLWEVDVCEVFIAPHSNSPQRYLEFEAAPTGAWVDLTVDTSQQPHLKDFEFQSGMLVATRIERNRVTIVMRLPWTNALPKPVAEEEWRANLFRCIGLGNERYLAWQPTYTNEPDFHVPEAFGVLRFGR